MIDSMTMLDDVAFAKAMLEKKTFLPEAIRVLKKMARSELPTTT